MAAQLIENILN